MFLVILKQSFIYKKFFKKCLLEIYCKFICSCLTNAFNYRYVQVQIINHTTTPPREVYSFKYLFLHFSAGYTMIALYSWVIPHAFSFVDIYVSDITIVNYVLKETSALRYASESEANIFRITRDSYTLDTDY